MKISKTIKRLEKSIASKFKNEKTGHDLNHLKRVYNLSRKIQKNEGGNLYVISIASFIHDLHRVLGNEEEKFISPKESIPFAKQLLVECEVDENYHDDILFIIENHDKKSSGEEFNLETKIVQDADIIDSLGKIGLKRTLTYCKTRNIPVKNTSIPLDDPSYKPEVHPISTCHFVYRTLLPSLNNIKTESGKNLAKNQMKPLKKFLKKQIGYTKK